MSAFTKYLQTKTLNENDNNSGQIESVLTDLINIEDNSESLIDEISHTEEVPAWIQSKITLSKDYLQSALTYLKAHKNVHAVRQGLAHKNPLVDSEGL